MTSTVSHLTPAPDGDAAVGCEAALLARYEEIARADDLGWASRYRKQRLLGSGGQGAVYLAQRLGADGFERPVALKLFSPESYRDSLSYQEDMACVGRV